MSPLLMETLMQGAIAVLRMANTAQAEHPTILVGGTLKQQLQAEMTIMSAKLAEDIQAERERRRNENG